MKVLGNGGLNLSELDGWWAEAYTPEVGWALGDGHEHGDDPAWDAAEANALYELLERDVVPEFYRRNQQGIPSAWVSRMRESMARLTPQFSANRTVREYTGRHYLPAAVAYGERAAEKGTVAKQILDWRRELEQKWPELQFGDMRIDSSVEQHCFDVQIHFNGLDPNTVRVELYADGRFGEPAIVHPMQPPGDSTGESGTLTYRACVSSARPANDFTARVVPNCDGVAIPLESNRILWQR
jgi:starch phosphorylase